GSHRRFERPVGGQQNHQDIRRLLTHRGQQGQSIHTRHVNIGDQQVRLPLGKLPQGRFPVLGGLNQVSLLGHDLAEQGQCFGIVVHYHHARFSQHQRDPPSVGSTIVNRDPSPGTLSTL